MGKSSSLHTSGKQSLEDARKPESNRAEQNRQRHRLMRHWLTVQTGMRNLTSYYLQIDILLTVETMTGLNVTKNTLRDITLEPGIMIRKATHFLDA